MSAKSGNYPTNPMDALLLSQRNGPARKIYKEQADAHRSASLSADIANKREFFQGSVEKLQPVRFDDLEDVKSRTFEYLRACERTSSFPSLMGLSAYAFGVSRSAVYAYLKRHPDTPTAHFIDRTRDLIADILSSAALQRNADAVTSIFILKNGLGFADRVEIEPVPHTVNDEMQFSAEDIARRYGVSPDGPETDEEEC